MYFAEETVKEIVVVWEKKPKKFELLIFYSGYWKSLGIKPPGGDKFSISIGVKMISGIKLILLGGSEEMTTANGKFKTIGIHKIELKTGYKNIGVRDCSKEENGKWFFSDVYWASNYGYVTFYWSLQRLYSMVNNLLFVIRITIRLPYYIGYLIHVGTQFSDRMASLTA